MKIFFVLHCLMLFEDNLPKPFFTYKHKLKTSQPLYFVDLKGLTVNKKEQIEGSHVQLFAEVV